MKNILIATSVAALLAACGGSDGGASTTITPDDANIDLSRQAKGLVTIPTTYGELRGYNQYASFYGLWMDNSKQIKELRYRGDKTDDVPTSGSATYKGNAVRWDTSSDKVLTDGTSTINVDFDKRTVNGKIDMPGLRRNITLNEGKLRGAEYAGTASVTGNHNGRYEGALYGENAKETAGQVSFEGESGLNTAFGGVRF
ncbi:Slam-dependent surface lipoprotein [uncultured Cardiobacterium sp.]|uniref:Slam-dependent surface lipoprotein n=1 Tax=uncultured Cardiobacterium sp. TaxID=417619 RepID=UPI0026118999|nr:Slam-dependent surface lipoprotein [uncultured Cardiobacterium sp.]